MPPRYNKRIFDESKILKRDDINLNNSNEADKIVDNINNGDQIANNGDLNINDEDQILDNTSKIEQKDNTGIPNKENNIVNKTGNSYNASLNEKSKKYLNIIEDEKKNNKTIKTKTKVSSVNNTVKPNTEEQLVVIQELKQMLELNKRNIIKAKIEIDIHAELFRNEYVMEDKRLYESKLKLLDKELKYLEKRKNILETILNNEISKR